MDELHITMHRDVALYILNHKRDAIAEMEGQFGIKIVILSDDSLVATDHNVERIGWQGGNACKGQKPPVKQTSSDDEEDDEEVSEDETETAEDEQPKRRKRGRRGGRRRRRRGGENSDTATESVEQAEGGQ